MEVVSNNPRGRRISDIGVVEDPHHDNYFLIGQRRVRLLKSTKTQIVDKTQM